MQDLHEGFYKRAVFYFPSGDEYHVSQYIEVPDHKAPGVVRDIHFKYCGHKLKRSVEFDQFVEESVPAKFQGRFSKSEKGIDIEICCDALKLASISRMERIFLMTNDSDFVPFCRTIKEFGANVSIIHLSSETEPNFDLLKEADSYDVVLDKDLMGLFVPDMTAESSEPIEADMVDQIAAELPVSEKPEAEPSALKSLDAQIEQDLH